MRMLRCGSVLLAVVCSALGCGHGTEPEIPSDPCDGGVCVKACTLDRDCDTGLVCNGGHCGECSFDSQCSTKIGRTHCDSSASLCVECTADFQCGSGSYCLKGACNVAVQCKVSADCAAQGPGAQACDNTGHCVQCFGASQAQANSFCGAGTPECNLAGKSCVQCLPANDQNGRDCGYPNNGSMDPHDASTCDPATFSCVPGCKFDEQCGCPRTAPNGAESHCARWAVGEHCDPGKTANGACVECTTNGHCRYKVTGSQEYGGQFALLNGARCKSDACVEGCDSDADCPASRICQNNKCVECKCDSPGADPTWCNSSLCSGTQVCDAQTLLCRQKRMGEECMHSNECGDTHDPTIGACLPTPAICVYHSHSGSGVGGDTYCAAAAQFGRCGVPCDDFFTNSCVQGVANCPSGSSCRQATGEDLSHVGAYCVPGRCNCTLSACP